MMSFSLPGLYLYYLPKDDLAPEEYERIISPIFAWMHIPEEYKFDDAHDRGFRLVNMHKRPCNPNPHQPRRYGPREAYRFRRRSVLLNALTGCQGPHKAPPFAKGDYKLPYGKWKFAFFTPNALPAMVTRVGIVGTSGYLYQFYTLDGTHDDPNVVGSWNKRSSSSSIHFNQAKSPPQYMVFCWDSLIDKKVYETSMFFPESVWRKMIAPAWNKYRPEEPAWYDTMLFGLAPEGKVRVWLQNSGGGDNYPVPVIKLKTVSGDKLDLCRNVTKSDFSSGYDQDIKEFIKGKTYPYGSWS